MKFSCEKYVLQNALSTAARAASAKSPIPALEGLLIHAGGKVRITGYDLKKGIYTDIEADISAPGAAVLNAKLFVEMIRRMPDGIVTVSVDEDNAVKVKCGKTEYNFVAMSADDYPELPETDRDDAVSVQQKVLRELIEDTVFAVSANESRPVYTGSRFEIENGVLTVISVDGYRLALKRSKLDGCDKSFAFIIPGSALQDVERICEDSEEPVMINVGTKHVSFTIGDTVVVSRRLEGDFLNYRKAIPEAFRFTLKIDRNEFLAAVDRVSLVVDEKVKNPLRLIFGDGKIDFSCVTPRGRAEDVCTCDGGGEDMEIGFNDRYLREALRAASKDELSMCINTGSSPCIFVPADGGDEFVYMILPVRLRAGE